MPTIAPGIRVTSTVAPRARTWIGIESFRDTEVEHLDRAVGSHFDVGRLQVAVHDAAFVCRVERVGNLPRDLQRLFQR